MTDHKAEQAAEEAFIEIQEEILKDELRWRDKYFLTAKQENYIEESGRDTTCYYRDECGVTDE